ncbi:MAG: phosphatidic acid phosphatase [Clostridia bacterium]|nr:phosphatidic acid phosphatase [Clostridia bacterium]
MRKPVVDYRKFRFSKLNTPEFSHLKLLSGWIVYFVLYLITENFIPQKECYVIHCKLDEMIPFCEWFIIPYVSWYLLIAWSLLYFALYDIDGFKKLMTFFFVAQVSSMIIYIIFPNRQDLRPVVFPRDNIITDAVKFLYSIDTDTNVCPSMHVGFSLAITSAWLKAKNVSRIWKGFIVFSLIVICCSVSLIKQHSVIDTVAAFALCAVIEIAVYGKSFWFKKLKKQK